MARLYDYEVKNTAPAVMTDKGPNGSTREKSKDGRYTVGTQVEDKNPEHKKETDFILNRQNVTKSAQQIRNSALDRNIYEPIFLNAMSQTFLRSLERSAEPGQKPVIIKGNNYNDLILGIDWIMFLEDKNGNQTRDLTVDVKTVEDGLGNKQFYDNPNITLNLYKTERGQIAFKEHSFLNKRHRNNGYCYIIPYSPLRAKDLDPNKSGKMDTKILEAKMAYCSRRNLHKYVQERILDNDSIKNLIHDYEQYNIKGITSSTNPYAASTRKVGKNSFRIKFPVPGENFEAELYLKEDADDHREVRVFLPLKAFDNPELKAIVKTVKL